MYKIGTFNKISPVGLSRLTDDFALVEDQNEANGIILRSYDMHEMDFSDNLLAIGRAGAGTNNIPVDKCAEQGIVVFNAPGANANAVKELCLAGMLLAARNIPEGLAWARQTDRKRQGPVRRNRDQRQDTGRDRTGRYRRSGGQRSRAAGHESHRL